MAELNNTGSGQWSEVDASNTSPSPNGWPAGTFFNQVEPIGQATMGAIKRFWDRINGIVTSGGASGTYTYTPSNISYPTAYVQGETYSFKADKASAGNDVININGLGAIKMFKPNTSGITQILSGDIQTGAHIIGQIDTSLDTGAGGYLIIGGLPSGAANPFSDASALVKNASDATKLVKLSAASVTTGTTRTLTAPDADTTLVGTDVQQTIANKLFQDSSVFFGDNSDLTKKLGIECSGIATGTTRMVAAQDKSGTMALLSDIAIKGWAKFTGTTLTNGTGITSISNGSTGNYTVTLPTQANANYAPFISCGSATDGRCINLFTNTSLVFSAPTTTSFIFSVVDTGNAARNYDYASILIMGS